MFQGNHFIKSQVSVATFVAATLANVVFANPLSSPPLAATSQPLAFTEINESTSGACNIRQCADLHVRLARFADQPALNDFLTQKLLKMAVTTQDHPATFSNVEELQRYFWNYATPVTTEYLQVNVLRSQKNLVVADLVRYIDTGGAHGETESHFVNWLVESGKALDFQSLLVPGAQMRFEHVLQQAHEDWLQSQVGQAIDDVHSFKKMWPFQSSHNVALMPDGLLVTYARYAIAPGSFGQPNFTIPYAALQGIIKPEILATAQSH